MEKTIRILRKNLKWIILFICTILFLSILENLFETEKLKMDILIYQIVVENMRIDILTSLFKIITNLGGAYFLIAIAVISLVIVKRKRVGLLITLNLGIATVLNLVIKNIIERPRPIGYRLIDETGYSFPSGHSMVSMAFYGFLIYMISKKVKNKTIRNISCILIGILIPLIGFSRIYLGVHYASDVFGGFLVGMAYLILFVTVTKSILEEQKVEKIKRNK